MFVTDAFHFTADSDQARGLRCACVQVDEANPGNPDHGPRPAAAINRVLDAVDPV